MAVRKKIDFKQIEKKIKKLLGDDMQPKHEISLSLLASYIDLHNQSLDDVRKNGAVIQYCRANGTSATKANPHVEVMLRMSGTITKLIGEFGLTPNSNKKLKGNTVPEDESELEKALKKLKG